jgi:hypothetical protein
LRGVEQIKRHMMRLPPATFSGATDRAETVACHRSRREGEKLGTCLSLLSLVLGRAVPGRQRATCIGKTVKASQRAPLRQRETRQHCVNDRDLLVEEPQDGVPVLVQPFLSSSEMSRNCHNNPFFSRKRGHRLHVFPLFDWRRPSFLVGLKMVAPEPSR